MIENLRTGFGSHNFWFNKTATLVLRTIIFVFCCLIYSTPSTAGNSLTWLDENEMECTHLLQGQFTKALASDVIRSIGKLYYTNPVICLNSPGGSLVEGIRLAKYFQEYGVPTRVMAGHHCLSACAVAFMGGTNNVEGNPTDRAIHWRARLGFHAPSLLVPDGAYTQNTVNKAYQIAVTSIAEILNASGDISIPLENIETMLRTPSVSFYDIDTVGRSLQWGVDVWGLPKPSQINDEMWLTACINLSGLERGTGPYLPIEEQHVQSTKNGSRMEVDVSFGSINHRTCDFYLYDLKDRFVHSQLMGSVELGTNQGHNTQSYHFQSLVFAPWNSQLATLANAPSNRETNNVLLRRDQRIPCAGISRGVHSSDLCTVEEYARFPSLNGSTQEKRIYGSVGWLKITMPGMEPMHIEQGGWPEYYYTYYGSITCTGDVSGFEKFCLSKNGSARFAEEIRFDCLSQAAAPFQLDDIPGVPIWSIGKMGAKRMCEASSMLDDEMLNGTTALARIRYRSGDLAGSVRLYRAAAEIGNATAQNGMGIAYLYGKGVERDVNEALRWFDMAMAQDHPFAYLHVGAIAERGLAGDKSTQRAISLYETAASYGSTGGLVRIGNIYRREQDIQKAAQYYQKAVENGDTEAMIILAELNMSGALGDNPNLPAGIALYVRAADLADRNANHFLAKGLQNGEIPSHLAPRNSDSYLLRAAELGHTEAMFEYGMLSHKQNNLGRAKEFLYAAQENGHDAAAAYLGQIE